MQTDASSPTLLAVESSCDETAVAVLRGFDGLLASEVASQVAEHARFGGVVPEVASRNHLLTTPPLVERALGTAGIALSDLDGVAATLGPGLAPALLVGSSFAKGLALGRGLPFYGINHMEGHLLSPFFGRREIPEHVGLVVSGGHTLLVHVRRFGAYRLLGRTLDDAAGEAFDKTAKLLGLPYPGGPEIEKLARSGRPGRFTLPEAMRGSGNLDFSFSGLKTAVRYLLEKQPDADRADVARAFQEAVTSVLVQKSLRAARQANVGRIAVSGGVGCNRFLQDALQREATAAGLEVCFTPNALSTDNAAMIAFVAAWRAASGHASGLDEEVRPNLSFEWLGASD